MPTNGKPFTDLIGEIEGGQLLRDLTEAVYNITHAVRETRKPGALKIAFKFTPTGRGSVEIDAKYVTDEPEHDRPTTTFFMSPDGTLLRNDPNQLRLPVREVDVPTNDPVRVAEGTGIEIYLGRNA